MTVFKIQAGLNYASQGHLSEDLGAAVATRHLPSIGLDLDFTWRAVEYQVAQGNKQNTFFHEHSLSEFSFCFYKYHSLATLLIKLQFHHHLEELPWENISRELPSRFANELLEPSLLPSWKLSIFVIWSQYNHNTNQFTL